MTPNSLNGSVHYTLSALNHSYSLFFDAKFHALQLWVITAFQNWSDGCIADDRMLCKHFIWSCLDGLLPPDTVVKREGDRPVEAQDTSYSKQPWRALTYSFHNYLSQMLNKFWHQRVFCFNHRPACSCIFLLDPNRYTVTDLYCSSELR